MGGDEFVLLCTDIAGAIEANSLAARIAEAFTEPFHCSVGSQRVGISIGVAISGSDSRPATLLSRADQAMYHAKNARRRASASAAPQLPPHAQRTGRQG